MSLAEIGAMLGEFLAMGGHGLYVWLSYGAALLVVVYNSLSVRLRERHYLRAQVDLERRHAHQRQTSNQNRGV